MKKETSEGAVPAAPEAPPHSEELAEMARLRDEMARIHAAILATGEAPGLAAPPANNDEWDHPLPGPGLPKRYYSPRYMRLRFRAPGGRYPYRFVLGNFVAKTEEEDALIRNTIVGKAGYVDDMPSRAKCATCGFSTFSSRAWMDHLSNGPHMIGM